MDTTILPSPEALLERDEDLARLRGIVDAAAHEPRRGAVVVVAGEAGSGKTALVRRWLDEERARARVLVGWCDDLAAARAFAPLHDVAGGAPPLRAALAGDDRGAVLDALVATLEDPLRPVVLVLEDVHWADDATLDAVRHVARRIAALGAVLVLTYREDEVGSAHPLVPVLGGLASTPVHRIAPAPLTVDAIARMAGGRDVDPAAIARTTGGNAFLVTALLSDPTNDVPDSVRDVVLGCLARLDDPARRLVVTLAEIPGAADLALVDDLADDDRALAEAEAIGLLVLDGPRCRFRHEIARLAVRDGVGRSDRRAASRRVLEQLLTRSSWRPGDDPATAEDPVRLAHFAAGAGATDVVAELGPHAAVVAHANGAYDVADRIQRAVLDHAHRLDPAVRARFDRVRAWTLYALGRHDEARDAAIDAVRTAEDLDVAARVRALVTASRMAYMVNDPAAAVACADRAVELADTTGDLALVADAAVARAAHAALVGEEDAVARADRAVASCLAAGREDLEAYARNYRGVALLHRPGTMAEAVPELERAIALGRRVGDHDATIRAVLNLTEAFAFARDPRLDGLLATAKQMDDGSVAMDGFRAHVDLIEANTGLDRGAWDDAEQVLERARSRGLVVGIIEVAWLQAWARLAVRRGDADAEQRLRAARAATVGSAALQFEGWMLALELEHAWLHEIPVDVDEVSQRVGVAAGGIMWAGELSAAARRVGVPEASLPVVDEGPWAPRDLSTRVATLRAAGLPYDAALVLVDAGAEEPLREALEVLDRLGAAPAAALARRRLAALGVVAVPRGPSRATRANPAGLTTRQVEVLRHLVAGRSNADIATALTLSVRTVEDHVSAVLAKLEVTTREEAAARGRDLLGA